jgi:hypothetical protein
LDEENQELTQEMRDIPSLIIAAALTAAAFKLNGGTNCTERTLCRAAGVDRIRPEPLPRRFA